QAAGAVWQSPDHAMTLAMLRVPDDFGGGMLEIFHFDRPPQDSPPPVRLAWKPGWTHICFTTTDIHATYEKLSGKGVKFVTPPVRLDLQGITVITPPDVMGLGAGLSLITYFYDPDGVLIELAQVV